MHRRAQFCPSVPAQATDLLMVAAPKLEIAREFRVRGLLTIKRVDSGRRVVTGEAMLSAPAFEEGELYRESDLAGLVHFDDMFLAEEDVRALADRFAIKGCSFDVEHQGSPVAAACVDSFVARVGWAPWTPGAWVVGVHIPRGSTYVNDKDEERDLWRDVEDGVLTGFSIQFMVRVAPVRVRVVGDDGEHETERTLWRASDPDPHFLSFVGYPATGAHFKTIDRAVTGFVDLPIGDAELEWNEAAARARVRSWAGGDELDQELYGKAFLWRNDDEPALLGSYQLQIADVVDDELVAIPRAIHAVTAQVGRAAIPDGDRAAVDAHLARYVQQLVDRHIVSVTDNGDGTASVIFETHAVESAPEDPETPESQGEPVKAGLAAPDLRGSAAGGEPTTNDTEPPMPETIEISDDEITRGLGATLWAKITGRGFKPATAPQVDPPADDGEPQVDPSADDTAATSTPDELYRAAVDRADFSDAMAIKEVTDDLWDGCFTLMDVLHAITLGAEDDYPDKPEALSSAVNEFSDWLLSKLSVPEDLSAAVARMAELRETVRAGRKMSKKRLERLTGAVDALSALRDELQQEPEEQVEASATAPSILNLIGLERDASEETVVETVTILTEERTAALAAHQSASTEREALSAQVAERDAKITADADTIGQLTQELSLYKRAPQPSQSIGPDDGAETNDKPAKETAELSAADLGRSIFSRPNNA